MKKSNACQVCNYIFSFLKRHYKLLYWCNIWLEQLCYSAQPVVWDSNNLRRSSGEWRFKSTYIGKVPMFSMHHMLQIQLMYYTSLSYLRGMKALDNFLILWRVCIYGSYVKWLFRKRNTVYWMKGKIGHLSILFLIFWYHINT